MSRNLGELASWGWEASMNARILETDDVAVDLALSGDHTNNEIVSLGEGVVESANFQLGLPWPNVTGVYLTSVEETGTPGGYTNAMCDPGVNGRPGGTPKLCSDLNQAEFENNVLYGPAFPTYNFSVGPTVTLFDNLQVFALAEGEYGRWFADIQAQYSHLYQNTEQSLLQTDPMYNAGLDVGDERYEGRVPADFWKLREIGARYNLPESVVSRIGGDRASISVSGRNLWTIWQKAETDRGGATIIDPEIAAQTTGGANTSLWTLPPIQSVNVTMRVTF